MKIRRTLSLYGSLIIGSFLMVSCGESEEEESVQTAVDVPQIQAISLSGLGTATSTALTLQETNECAATEGQGIFSLAFGGACHSAGIAANLLLGDNGGDPGNDGSVNCEDYSDDDQDTGILMHLMCGTFIQSNPNTTDFAFEGDGTAIAADFRDFDATDSMTAVGAWTAGSSTSLPANIRLWSGTSLSNAAGIMGLKLTDIQNGELYFDSTAFNASAVMQVAATFSTKSSAENCSASPSTDTCHYQDVRLYTPQAITDGPPQGFHVKILANDIDNPSFLAIEGSYLYDQNGIANGGALAATRKIYFQVVEKDDVVWGIFKFLDVSGNPITVSTSDSNSDTLFNNFLTTLSSTGICSNDLVSDSDNFTAGNSCADLGVDTTAYEGIFSGVDSFEDITATPFSDVWGNDIPTEVGIRTL